MVQNEIVESTQEVGKKFRQFEEFSDRPLDSRVARFARFVATRLNNYPQITPRGFIMATTLASIDLANGTNGYSREPIEHKLVGQPGYVYDLFIANTGKLAEIAFSAPFAEEVNLVFTDLLVKTNKQEDEWVLSPVVTIDQALEDIVANARKRVLALDWARFEGASEIDNVATHFDNFYELCLRNSGYKFPLNILDGSVEEEHQAIDTLPENRKKALYSNNRYWLALLRSPVGVEEATFIRDWLALKVPEPIAAALNLSPEEVIDHFGKTNESFLRCAKRSLALMQMGLF